MMTEDKIKVDAIAGYCLESTLWKMLCDLSQRMLDEGPSEVDSSSVLIDGESFVIAPDAPKCDEAEAVWNIGALVSCVSSGHTVFGGKGKVYQEKHPNVELPMMRREHESITAVVHRCMQASPSKRISLEELMQESAKGLAECKKREGVRVVLASEESFVNPDSSASSWPEEMIEV